MRLPLALAALALAAPVADAREVARGEVTAGPRLTADGVMWAQLTPSGMRILLSPTAGGTPRTVARVAELRPDRRPPAVEGSNEPPSFTLRASDTHLALGAQTGNFVPESGDVTRGVEAIYSGALAETPRRLFRCVTDNYFGAPMVHGFDLDGGRLAYMQGGCAIGPQRIVVRDLATGTSSEFAIPEPAGNRSYFERRDIEVELAGRFVAYANTFRSDPGDVVDEVVVRDLEAGAETYAFRPAARFRIATRDIRLQPDGKLAVAYAPDASGCAHVGWLSPAEPRAHDVSGCGVLWAMAGDGIVHSAGERTRELLVSDLAGATTTVAIADAPIDLDHDAVDFDGTRLAVALSGCTPASGQIRILDPASPDAPVAAACPLNGLASRTLRPDRRGRVRVRPRCPQGCSSTGVHLLTGSGRRTVTLAAAGPTAVEAGGRFTLRLNAQGQRELARRGRLAARLRFFHYTRRGRPIDAIVRRTFSVTLWR